MKRLLSLFVVLAPMSCVAGTGDQPEEAGKVAWGRDLDAALAASRQTGKPVFALFQEIPGCAGCKQFGRDVMSNPLLVEAVETEFTPLLIHNNKPGRDAEVLRRFGEPAWNYQVVRFLDADAKDIIPRRDQVWDTGGIADRMITTLTKAGRPVPAYLRLLAAEHSPRLRQAVFSMYCFWTGEMALGRIDGVVTTEAGFMGGREVTLVRYDPAVISLPKLIAEAEKVECANAVHVPAADLAQAKASRLNVGTLSGYRAAPASDQKKQLQGTAAAGLVMTAAQATKVNAFVRSDGSTAMTFLTPSQRTKLQP
ncbi:MAG: VPGUxxT family thioredoxin-like (seleno)protein, type 2 [Prosthecobacter sp.]